MTKEDVKKNIKPVFERYEGTIVFAYLFGSTARDATAPLSDIDIAVFFEKGDAESYFEAKISLYADLCRALKTNKVDLVVLNTATNLLLMDEIIRTGIVFADSAPETRLDFELDVLHRSLDFRSHRLAVMGV